MGFVIKIKEARIGFAGVEFLAKDFLAGLDNNDAISPPVAWSSHKRLIFPKRKCAAAIIHGWDIMVNKQPWDDKRRRMLGFGGRKGRIRAAFNQLSLFDVAPTRKTRRRTIMTEWTALAAAIEKHWRTHCPKMVRELTKANQLKS
jgi:hypothetical protein